MSQDPNEKDPKNPQKKKVYGNPIFGENEDITNQAERVPMSDLERDGTEPDIEKLYDNDSLNNYEENRNTSDENIIDKD